ncbi:MAG TPA: ABC transporter substrate-binding protein [Streptosporangiaceae bacterium]|nr:ABC transporter substrate-binding protein [Streptosporangiaceae bacterium]
MTSQRSRRTRACALVAVAAVLAVSAAACSSAAPGAVRNSTLTVVTLNPFTGPDGPFGPEQAAGCQAAATAINAAGGVLTDKVVCANVDTQGNPADAVTAAAKMLATTPHLLGVLGPSSDEADATAPLINAAKVPMFADTGEASFDHNKLPYFWRMIPADDVRGYAMALYAKQKGYLRGAAVFGNDVGGSQAGVPTLLRGYSEVGGLMVINQKITLGQTSYQSQVEQLIAAKPQVIFTETSPTANATYLAELQQLGHLVPVIGTDVTIQPSWFSAMAESIGKPALTKYFVAESPYAAASGPGWQVYNKDLLASSSVPKPPQWSTDSYTMGYYDAVVLMALAATATKSTSPAVWNASIPSLTTSGALVVHSYAEGLAALNAGKKIDYVGATGIIAFNQWHNSGGGFEIAAYQSNGSLNLVSSISAAQLVPLIK